MSTQGRERSGATAGKGDSKDPPPTRARSGAVTEGKATSTDTDTAQDTPATPQDAGKEAKSTPNQWKPAQKGTGPPTNLATVGQARATAAAKNAARNPVFLGGRYAINAYVWRTVDQNAEAAGSILSQSLDKSILSRAPDKYAGDISLGQLRKLTPGMSSFSRIHRFCTSDGTVLQDETISLDDYLALDLTEGVERVKDSAAVATTEPEKQDGEEATDGTKKKAATGGKSDATKPAENQKTTVPKISIYYRTPPRVATAGMDLTNATGPALNMAMRPVGAPGIDANGNLLPLGQAAAVIAPPLTSVIGADRSLDPIYRVGKEASVVAGDLSETQWNVVLRNCAVFYGWKVDKASGQITRAPRAAFQLRSKIEGEPVASIPTFAVDPESIARKKAEAEDAEYEKSLFERVDVDHEVIERAERQSAQELQRTELPQPGQGDQLYSRTVQGMPNFRVNDDSRIEIAACQSTLAVSLAKSDFSSQSTEASASGGAFGVTVGVSAGYATSKENKSTKEDGVSTQTLVARYMYPRCDIFLRAEDLEPTPEFTDLLNKAKNQRSIDAVRAIQDQYGQLFCQELTLGARLLTTKILTSVKHSEIDEKKEQMKVSVGVSVQSPFGGGSVKHEQESGSGENKSKVTTTSQETNVFEAVGGDTILANNPAAWALSVSAPNTWRVVNRDGLSTMIDMISAMPGFEKVQSWFVQAIPALNKYIRLDAALSVNVRFKVLAPTNSLSVENRGNALFYLGFKPGTTTTPRLNGYESSTGIGYWARVDVQQTFVLFSPASFRAPCLHGFDNFSVGDAPFGSKYNPEFTETQWNVISPFGDEFNTGTPYELKHGSRVIMRTVPFRNPNLELKADGVDPTPPPSHMVVFRNAQGVFVPAISDRDEYQYWRIEKTAGGNIGEPIKGGDSVRLCWKFADQITGFRDYWDDAFGRRRNQCPPELESTTLYLKVPWPRFEVKNRPTAMIMSTQSTTELTQETLAVKPGKYCYSLQDVQFRIDTVERRGLGDSDDYMLAGVNQESDETNVTVTVNNQFWPRPASGPLQVWGRIAAFGVEAGFGF